MKSHFWTALALSVSANHWAAAGEIPHRISLSGMATVVFATGDFRDNNAFGNARVGQGVSGGIGYMLTRNFGLAAAVHYNQFNNDGVNVKRSLYTVGIDGQYLVFPHLRLSPLASLGVFYGTATLSLGGVRLIGNGQEGTATYDLSMDWSYGLHCGIGVTYQINSRIGIIGTTDFRFLSTDGRGYTTRFKATWSNGSSSQSTERRTKQGDVPWIGLNAGMTFRL